MVLIRIDHLSSKEKLSNRTIGIIGENIVALCLTKKNYKILGRNVTTPFGEIDIIARKNAETFFIEVKTRRQNYYGLPEEAVTKQKMLHLSRSCLALAPKYAGVTNWSIMVVSVELDLAGQKAVLGAINLNS